MYVSRSSSLKRGLRRFDKLPKCFGRLIFFACYPFGAGSLNFSCGFGVSSKQGTAHDRIFEASAGDSGRRTRARDNLITGGFSWGLDEAELFVVRVLLVFSIEFVS